MENHISFAGIWSRIYLPKLMKNMKISRLAISRAVISVLSKSAQLPDDFFSFGELGGARRSFPIACQKGLLGATMETMETMQDLIPEAPSHRRHICRQSPWRHRLFVVPEGV
jgi:hypothetical protein